MFYILRYAYNNDVTLINKQRAMTLPIYEFILDDKSLDGDSYHIIKIKFYFIKINKTKYLYKSFFHQQTRSLFIINTSELKLRCLLQKGVLVIAG